MTRTLKLGTGIALVIQRDTIQTAKLVASLDQVSEGRFLFGIGGGWNAEGDGGPRHGIQNPLQEAARADRGDEGNLDQDEARILRRSGEVPADDGVAESRCRSPTRR